MLSFISGKFLRWYRINKVKFWRYIVAIALGYALIMTFNNNAKQKREVINNTEQIISTPSKASNSTIESSKVIIGGNTKSQEELQGFNNQISVFVNYCNQEKIENAYNMLSQDCKDELYPTLESFISNYYNRIFTVTKTYSIQNYSGDTYRVIYKDSLLETGGNASNSEVADYITIDSKNKLSISSYIGREVISKEYSIGNLKFNVLERNIYIDYEKHKIDITNEGNYDARISDLKSARDIYASDSNNEFCYVFLNELPSYMVNISSGTTKTAILKFSKAYNQKSVINTIYFENIILDINDEDDFEKLIIEI